MPTLIRERTVTARKAHRCGTCNQDAARPGDQYRRATYVYDGRVYDWVQCRPCEDMAFRVWEWSTSDEGIGPGDYAEWANDHAEHGTPLEQAMAKHYLARLIR